MKAPSRWWDAGPVWATVDLTQVVFTEPVSGTHLRIWSGDNFIVLPESEGTEFMAALRARRAWMEPAEQESMDNLIYGKMEDKPYSQPAVMALAKVESLLQDHERLLLSERRPPTPQLLSGLVSSLKGILAAYKASPP